MKQKTRLMAVVAMLVLAWATPALAQIPVVPGTYSVHWVRTSHFEAGGDPTPPEPLLEGGVDTITLDIADGLGVCATMFVTGVTGDFACIDEQGRVEPSNFSAGAWTQYTPTVAVVEIDQGHRGSTAHEEYLAVGTLVAPLPLKVFITAPRPAATVSGTAWIVLWVEGTTGTVNRFTVYVDGGAIATRTTTARGPVAIPWPTTSVPNGAHTVRATVRAGSLTGISPSLTVTVNN